MCKTFFDEPKDASKVKGQIVANYFGAWAKIILGKTNHDVAYIDLFCGPGRYEDDTESTPLLVLRKAIENPLIQKRFVSIFTDRQVEHIERLRKEIYSLQAINTLKYKPQLNCLEVGEDIVKVFKNARLIPSFIFLDPCGYKGLSLELINAVIKDWACECLFFFNYNRINAAIHNDKVEEHVIRIFGIEKAEELRQQLIGLNPYNRERKIIETLEKALKDAYGKFVLPFCIKYDDKDKTSHYLIFVTKSFLGYDLMKQIMSKHSTDFPEGVPSFELNKRKERGLFEHPMRELKGALSLEYAGKTCTMDNIYKQHSIGKVYISSNYKKALCELLYEGKIVAKKPDGRSPRKGTMPDDCIITFLQG